MKPSRCNNKTKWLAREASIVEPAKGIFGPTLPGNYVTLCNMQSNNDCYEYKQMLDSGLIEPSQFHGVDLDERIIYANKIILPNSTWYCGDLYNYLCSNHVKPSVVYFDTISMARKAIPAAQRIMRILPIHTLFVLNVVSKHPYNGTTDSPDELIDTLFDSAWFTLSSRWGLIKLIQYESEQTEMTSFSFYQE